MCRFSVFLAALFLAIAVLLVFLLPYVGEEGGEKHMVEEVDELNLEEKEDELELNVREEGDEDDVSAVIVSGAFGYENYATQADACHTYHLLLKGGINRDNLVVMMAEDIAYHPENVEQGVIRHWVGGPNVYLGFRVDYLGDSFTLGNFEAVITGNKRLVTGGSGRVLSTNSKSRIFFFFSSHGDTEVARFGRDLLTSHYLLAVLYMNHKLERYESMVIYASSCKSGSMFTEYDKAYASINIYVMTSASPNEVAYRIPVSDFHRTSLGGLFAVEWTKDSEKYNRRNRTLEQQYLKVKLRMHSTRWSSTPMQYGAKHLTKRTLDLYHGYDRDGPT